MPVFRLKKPLCMLFVALTPWTACGMEPWLQIHDVSQLTNRLDEQAAQIADLKSQLQSLQAATPAPSTTVDACGESTTTVRVPVVTEVPVEEDCGEAIHPRSYPVSWIADYDGGFRIRPVRPDQHPFQIKVNGWVQFRHIGFSRDRATWTNNAGVTRTIRNRNAFDIERGRLVFSGFAGDRRLTYFLQLDGDTDGRHVVDFFDYWWAWKFGDRLRLQFGKRKVPGTREWLLGARDTRLSDRPVATDFFRPDRTLGLFANGKLGDKISYELMLGNGFSTANRTAGQINNDFAVSGTMLWNPGTPFGRQLTDHDISSSPKSRFGQSFTWAGQRDLTTTGTPLQESDFVRLADGTRLLDAGALAAGATVSDFDVYLYALDTAWKYQGWSISSEIYLRWLQDLRANAALPLSKFLQHGFYVEGGRIIVPQRLDWNVRYSQVRDRFGGSSEYGAGINWYPMKSKHLKLSFDVTKIDGSPVNNTATELLAGDSGTLFRTQLQAQF